MTVLYKLASGQLSKQSHYDFGLRALKSVLVMAGELKRGSPDLHEVCVHAHMKLYVGYVPLSKCFCLPSFQQLELINIMFYKYART